MKRILLFALAMMCIGCSEPAQELKPRTIITTDGEVDDMDSFIRLMLYANDLDIEAIVYTSSQWHWSGDGKGTLFTSQQPHLARRYGEMESFRWLGLEWIQDFIDKYEVSYPNLIQHDPDYPSPDHLRSILKVGNVISEGDMTVETEGSEFIREIIMDDEPGPIYVQAWGGNNTLARALLSIEEDNKDSEGWETLKKKISEKLVIMTIQDQDATYRNYIGPNWPEIRVVRNNMQFWAFAYGWAQGVPKELHKYLDGNWFKENIKFGHGPLMATYYTWGEGYELNDPDDHYSTMEETEAAGRMKYDFISEGDSPAFLALLDFGLRSTEDFSWGGLGGRYAQSKDNPYLMTEGRDLADFNPITGKEDRSWPIIRWLNVLQNDFAARADWCVNDFENANHRPVASVRGSLDLTAVPGEKIVLKGRASDPDNDKMSARWWQYHEADTYDGKIEIAGADSYEASFTVPADAVSGDTIHVIYQITDDGTPSLSHYQRIIITVV